MCIGMEAKKAGVGVETIRFYERRGTILQPQKPAGGGFRHYPERIVRKVRFIKHARALGFVLSEVEDFFSMETNTNADGAHANIKLESVARKIASLKIIEAALENIINVCPGHGTASKRCSISATLKSSGNELPE